MKHEKIVGHRFHFKSSVNMTPPPKKKPRLINVPHGIGVKSVKISDKIDEEINRLWEKVSDAKKRNDVLKQTIKTMESGKQTEKIIDLESSQNKLQEEIDEMKTEADQISNEIEEKIPNSILVEKVEVLTKELEDVKKENKELKRGLEEMRKKVDDLSEKLECKETRLALGQVAWLLEEEIWKAVLPDEEMGYTGILRSMRHWLKTHSSTKDGKAAQKRWKDLKKKLNWDEKCHNHALKCLKDLRVGDAHPKDVDLEVARKQLKDGKYVANADKKVCENIIDMVVTARKLNTS